MSWARVGSNSAKFSGARGDCHGRMLKRHTVSELHYLQTRGASDRAAPVHRTFVTYRTEPARRDWDREHDLTAAGAG